MNFHNLIIDKRIPEISYLTNRNPEVIHPRVTFQDDVPYVYCKKKTITLEVFLRRFASGEKGLWLAGYRSSNGRQSTITFSEINRLTLGPKFLSAVELIQMELQPSNKTTIANGKESVPMTRKEPSDSGELDTELNVSNRLQEELEKVLDQVAVEYANKPGEDVDAIVKRRVGQGAFRALLQKTYGTSCWLSGLEDGRLLIASHIVPWSLSDSIQKTDPENGLLLSVSWDALFDKGYISFDDDGQLLCSDLLNEDTVRCLGISKQSTLSKTLMTEQRKKNLGWHRKHHGFKV